MQCKRLMVFSEPLHKLAVFDGENSLRSIPHDSYREISAFIPISIFLLKTYVPTLPKEKTNEGKILDLLSFHFLKTERECRCRRLRGKERRK
ncbi:hypothetical protein CEXT_593501 [Caerostris extrusa]|uniref:Uncharacterized protein n=1 Tax=Caerostris extrusa TaxID=172846 RepID=A0AAV4PFY7_CAEEX|nr:hypothetical protein CEXT_593501 [Caerostris extrusa]